MILRPCRLVSRLCLVCVFALFVSLNALCQRDSPAAPSLIPVADAEHGFAHGRTQGTDLGPASPSLALEDLRIVLQRSSEQQQALDILLARQNQQGDPLFHAWLSPAEYGETFGIAAGDLATVRDWLQGQGFTVNSVHPGELVIDFSGTVAQVERAFKVEIRRYRDGDGSIHMATSIEEQIPKQIARTVLGFTGLDGRARPLNCEIVPDPVQQALEQNANQLSAVQGYPSNNPCELSPPQTIRDNVSGAITLLASFTGQTGAAPGGSPKFGNLIQASDGNFYGTSYAGGVGYGTVFKITSAGVYGIVHPFSSASTDGQYPWGGVIQGIDGNFYGTTQQGGTYGYGTVFKLTPAGAVTLMHSFANTDGGSPYAALIQGTDGNFYGTTEAGGANSHGTAFKILSTSPYTFSLLHSFSAAATDGQQPEGTLLQGVDGNFYGTTSAGGASGNGTVFKMLGASPYTVTLLHSFAGGTGDGATPVAGLIQSTDGNFYGTTEAGGSASSYGTVFKILAASPYTVTLLHTFTGGTSDGEYPYAGLVLGTDGNFYGTNYLGGTSSKGTIYEVSSGSYTVLHSFAGAPADGNFPYAGLVQGLDGNFYGTTFSGGVSGYGTIYKMTMSPTQSAPVQLSASATTVGIGQSFTMSYSVTNTDTGTLAGTLNQCFESNTSGDTTYWNSVVNANSTTATKSVTAIAVGTFNYALTCGGIESNLVTMTITKQTPVLTMATPTAAAPVSQILGSLSAFNVTATLTWTGSSAPTTADVKFTSTAIGTFGAVTCGSTSPATCTAVFTPTATDASGSYSSSAAFSGDSNFNSTSASTISNDYLITAVAPVVTVSAVTAPYGSTAAVTVTATESGTNGVASGNIVTFGTAGGVGGSFSPTTCTIAAGSCTTTYIPSGTLTVGTYASDITASFSASTSYAAANATSALTIAESFAFSLLASFTGNTGADIGANPYYASLIQASDGNLYGLTCSGGANGEGGMFSISTSKVYTLLYSFSAAGTLDGQCPMGALVQATDGNFYGATTTGGANGSGTIFRITSTGAFTLLHSLASATDGGDSSGGLTQASDGNFYGMTQSGGANNQGTIFRISPNSPYVFTVMHNFSTALTDGKVARGGLIQGTDGNLYGMTESGGANTYFGTVFKISTTSPYTFTLIHSFAASDGAYPFAGLIQATDGNFYGMTYQGGASNNGAVFVISPVSPYALTLLHSFTLGSVANGATPFGNLVQATDGTFYGTTNQGGANAYGTVFQITSAGSFSLIHSFSNSPTDGSSPYGNLVQGADGNLYGMTAVGGADSQGTIFELAASPSEKAPVQLSSSATTVNLGQSFTLSYSVLNAYTGSAAGTLNQCLESNAAGDTTYWNGIVDATSTTATKPVTPTAGGTFTYALTCGGMESSLVTITVNPAVPSLSLVAATPGNPSTGVASTQLTAIMAPAVSGVTVTFTDSTTGEVFTATTNSSGVATTAVIGTSAGPNIYVASIAASNNNTGATSNAVTVRYAGILLSSDLTHNFSVNPGTYDGSPICNGSNGSNGSTCTTGYGIVVTNFTTTTQLFQLSLSSAGSPSNAFSSITNCPVAGLSPGTKCNYIFYYLPPYGDGCSLTTTCVTPVGQTGPQGTFESTTWTLASSTTIFGIAAGGPVSFPTTLDGKALLAPGNALTVAPAALTFGAQAPGDVSAVQNVTVTNSGAASIGVTYAISNNSFTTNNGCALTLAAGTSCQIQVTYSDASIASDSGNLTITPTSGNAITVALSGSTVSNTGLSLSTIVHNFGSVTDGSAATFGLSVTNNSATIAVVSFSNSAGTGFTAVNGCSATLPAGASCNYTFTFAPTAPGASIDSLLVTSNVPILPGGSMVSPFTDTVTVTGTGVGGGSFTATSVAHNFGTVAVGSAATVYGVQLANNTSSAINLLLGGGTFSSSGIADGYSVVTNCGESLAVNSNCEVEFTFTPTSTGPTQVMYPVAGNASGRRIQVMSGGIGYSGITLTGTGQ